LNSRICNSRARWEQGFVLFLLCFEVICAPLSRCFFSPRQPALHRDFSFKNFLSRAPAPQCITTPAAMGAQRPTRSEEFFFCRLSRARAEIIRQAPGCRQATAEFEGGANFGSLTIAVHSDQNPPPLYGPGGGGMKILARRIKRELEKRTERNGHCAIYEDELQRIWPLNEQNRKAKIAEFAKENGFKLSFYKQGLCAIFEKE
jgi:hypothetical protein